MSAETIITATSDLPPRTWRQWWRQLPSWQRILALGFGAVAALHVAVALRIVIGLQEERGLARLRQCGVQIQYAWDGKRELFRGHHTLLAGLFGRSARNVTNLTVWESGRLSERDLKFIGSRCVNLQRLDQADAGGGEFLPSNFFDDGPRGALIPSNIELSTQVLTALKGCRRLTHLDLSNTNIDDDGVRQLLDLKELEHLDLTGTCVSNDIVSVLHQFPKLKGVNATYTAVSVWAEGEAELRYPGRTLHIEGAMMELVKEFQGTVRWSDGELTGILPIEFEFVIEGPPDDSGERRHFRRLGIDLNRPALYVSPRELVEWGDGDYRLALKLGRYDAEPVTVRVHNNTAATHRIEFRMPVTKAEALSERGALAP